MTAHRRIAAAPISWGVCEVPGWGYQMDANRVLKEMAKLGFTAVEAGPKGFLPADALQARDLCAAHGIRLIGGFVPAVLHRTDYDDSDAVIERIRWLVTAGADFMVLACTTGLDGYDSAPDLDKCDQSRLAAGVDRICDMAREHGLLPVVHPHVGTVVERADQIDFLLEATSASFCLDTGHLMIGGVDPVEFAEYAKDRISLLQLKDVDSALVRDVQAGRAGYVDAVRAGLYGPLGSQDVDVPAVLHAIGGTYKGWYVLEQDVALEREPAVESGPHQDAATSRNYLLSILTELAGCRPIAQQHRTHKASGSSL